MLNHNKELTNSIITLHSKVELNHIFTENGISEKTEKHRQSAVYAIKK